MADFKLFLTVILFSVIPQSSSNSISTWMDEEDPKAIQGLNKTILCIAQNWDEEHGIAKLIMHHNKTTIDYEQLTELKSGIKIKKYKQRIMKKPKSHEGGIGATKIGSLEIRNLEASDNGNYYCSVVTSDGDGSHISIAEYQLKTYYPPTLEIVGPFTHALFPIKSVDLKCKIASRGNPPEIHKLEWLHNGTLIDYSDPKFSRHPFSLEIHNVTSEDGGFYSCRVQNFDHPSGWGTSPDHFLEILVSGKASHVIATIIIIVLIFIYAMTCLGVMYYSVKRKKD